jgi:hypothetical protein
MRISEFIQACAQQDATKGYDNDPSSLLLFQTSQHATKFSVLEDGQA